LAQPSTPSDALLAAARAADRVLITGPLQVDGDSLGASLALARALRALGVPRVDVTGHVGTRYSWLPDAESLIPEPEVAGSYDLAVVVDGDRTRLAPAVERAYDIAHCTAIIDHHVSTEASAYDIALVDVDMSSTCAMVLDLLDAWGIPLDRDLATLLYTGFVFDTGSFRHPSTAPVTHHMAARLLATGIDHSDITTRVLFERSVPGLRLMSHALGRTRLLADGVVALSWLEPEELVGTTVDDTEGIIDLMLCTRGVSAAVLLLPRGETLTKVSLRSRHLIDVAALARRLWPTGGGHARAAGAMVPQSLDQTRDTAAQVLLEAARPLRASAK